jgi:hypothetical protein
MQTNKTFRPGKVARLVSAFSILGLSLLQACGNASSVRSSDANNSAASNDAIGKNESTQSVDGTWFRACDPNKSPTEERLTLKDGRFTHEMIGYKNDCKDKAERFVTSGTYQLGDAALNPQELTFESGNFALKPTAIKGIRNIDFTIEKWTFELTSPTVIQDRIELEKLMVECPALKVETTGNVVQIQRNGCELSGLTHNIFDIVSVNQDEIRLGLYIGDLNSFDPAGKSTPELRSNVISNLPLFRVK